MNNTTKQFELYKKMLVHFAQKYNIPDAPKDYESAIGEWIIQILFQARKKLLENVHDEIVAFCKENPHDFSQEDIAIIAQRRNMQVIEWYIMQHKKNHTLFFDNEKSVVYAINEINQEISEVLPKESLPYRITTGLLPFAWWLIRDGIISWMNIYYSTSIKKSLREEMRSIVVTSWVTTTLTDEEISQEDLKAKKWLSELVYMLKQDPDFYGREISLLVEQYPICKAYYMKQSAKTKIRAYRKEAKILWFEWYYVALVWACICGTGKTNKEAMNSAKEILPKEYHNTIEIKKV